MDEKTVLKELTEDAKDMVAFLGNPRKPERECWVCREFLHCLGVEFKEGELIAPTEEPRDVDFRDARFQVLLMLDEDRRMHDEWKKKADEFPKAKCLENLSKDYIHSEPISLDHLISKIVCALSKKAGRYGKECKNLDALVYVNLQNKHLVSEGNEPNISKLKSQGWRSASFLFPPYGVVIYSESGSPAFINSINPFALNRSKLYIDLFEKQD